MGHLALLLHIAIPSDLEIEDPGAGATLFRSLQSGVHSRGRVFDQAGASGTNPSRAGVPAARRI
jgi:hypothetical protein